VEWSAGAPPFPEQASLYDHIRKATARKRQVEKENGNVVEIKDGNVTIGGKYFNVQLDWNKKLGNDLYAPGKAQPKNPSEHKIVGQPIKRDDVAPRVFCQEDYCTDIKLPDRARRRLFPVHSKKFSSAI
jgi:hypothetical protein